METLLIVPNLSKNLWFLKDAKGHVISVFHSAEQPEEWARENGYRTRRV